VTAKHPSWWGTLLWGGTVPLLRQVVGESLIQVRQSRGPRSLPEVSSATDPSVLSELGGVQDYLYYYVRLLRPQIVVETGVFRGISTAFLLAGLVDNGIGHLYSIDLPGTSYQTDQGRTDSSPLGGGVDTGYVVPGDLKSRWTLLLGDSRVVLPELLERVGSIDMFIHDSEHRYDLMTWEFALAFDHLRPGGLLLSDDVSWNLAFSDFVNSHSISWSQVVKDRLGVASISESKIPDFTTPGDSEHLGSQAMP